MIGGKRTSYLYETNGKSLRRLKAVSIWKSYLSQKEMKISLIFTWPLISLFLRTLTEKRSLSYVKAWRLVAGKIIIPFHNGFWNRVVVFSCLTLIYFIFLEEEWFKVQYQGWKVWWQMVCAICRFRQDVYDLQHLGYAKCYLNRMTWKRFPTYSCLPVHANNTDL